METYLTNLITEKGIDLDTEIKIKNNFGFTYKILIEYIITDNKANQKKIRNMLLRIDFNNGDVFHFLNHLATGLATNKF